MPNDIPVVTNFQRRCCGNMDQITQLPRGRRRTNAMYQRAPSARARARRLTRNVDMSDRESVASNHIAAYRKARCPGRSDDGPNGKQAGVREKVVRRRTGQAISEPNPQNSNEGPPKTRIVSRTRANDGRLSLVALLAANRRRLIWRIQGMVRMDALPTV